MGTMRWEKESAERVSIEVDEVARKLKRVTLDAEQAELEVRMKAVQTELIAKQVEKSLLGRTTASRKSEVLRGTTCACANCAAAMPPPHGESDPVMSRRAKFKFRLYVAADTANSMQAMANLSALCREHLAGRHEIEIVDVFREPLRALAEGIRMTPTLIVLAPGPARRIVGTLGQTQRVLDTLGIDSRAA